MTVFLHIAIPTPLRRQFDYLPPAGIDPGILQPGQRVEVPFGRRRVIGLLLGIDEQSELPRHKLKRAHAVLDQSPVLGADLLELLQWASRYYQHPIGEVMLNALPVLLRRESHPQRRGSEHWIITLEGIEALEAGLKRAPKQAALLASLQSCPEGIDAAELDNQHASWRPIMNKLRDKGWVDMQNRSTLPPPLSERQTAPVLTPAQASAVEQLADQLDRFACSLLDGVTGSGKTEVYLQLIERVLAAGR
ncbi:MAG: primosomal protein N', partial [Thiohalophilus sp.]